MSGQHFNFVTLKISHYRNEAMRGLFSSGKLIHVLHVYFEQNLERTLEKLLSIFRHIKIVTALRSWRHQQLLEFD